MTKIPGGHNSVKELVEEMKWQMCNVPMQGKQGAD